MNYEALCGLLKDFEAKKRALLHSRGSEYHSRIGWCPDERFYAISPDDWISDVEIMLPYDRFKTDCPPSLKEFADSQFELYNSSSEAAKRFIVARDFNEFRDGNWQMLWKLKNHGG